MTDAESIGGVRARPVGARPFGRIAARAARLVGGSPAPDLRFELQRGRTIRSFVSFMLLVQIVFAVVGMIVGRANHLSPNPTVETWASVSLIGLTVLFLAAVRLARRPALVEIASLAAGLVSIMVAGFALWQDPLSTVAVATYLAVAIAVAAYAVPWRPVTHYAWVTAAAAVAIYSITWLPNPDQRDALAGALAFAMVVSFAGKPIAWNGRVEAYKGIQQVRRLNAQLLDLSLQDPQTGASNRAALDGFIVQLTRRARGRIGFAMIDIDRFKGINDTLGHVAGDEILRRVAEVVTRAVRDVDRVFRYGGDEFIVALERTDDAGIVIAAERICAAVVSEIGPATDDSAAPVTVSIGVAAVALPASYATLQATIAEADQRLYRAKSNGRNRVERS